MPSAGIALTKENNLCVEGFRALGIFNPGIDGIEPNVKEPLKSRGHFLTEGGNKISIFYNLA